MIHAVCARRFTAGKENSFRASANAVYPEIMTADGLPDLTVDDQTTATTNVPQSKAMAVFPEFVEVIACRTSIAVLEARNASEECRSALA